MVSKKKKKSLNLHTLVSKKKKKKNLNLHTRGGAFSGRIYVGALPKNTTKDTFYKHFRKYGKIKNYLMLNAAKDQISGFGFITYADPSVVDKMIPQLQIINGEKVEITRTIAESNDFNKNERSVADLFKAMAKSKMTKKKDQILSIEEDEAIGTPSASGVLNWTIKGRPMKKSKNRKMKPMMEEILSMMSNMTL